MVFSYAKKDWVNLNSVEFNVCFHDEANFVVVVVRQGKEKTKEKRVTILLHGDLEDLWCVYMGADNVP